MYRDKNGYWELITKELIIVVRNLTITILLMPMIYVLDWIKPHLGRALFFKLWGINE